MVNLIAVLESNSKLLDLNVTKFLKGTSSMNALLIKESFLGPLFEDPIKFIQEFSSRLLPEERNQLLHLLKPQTVIPIEIKPEGLGSLVEVKQVIPQKPVKKITKRGR